MTTGTTWRTLHNPSVLSTVSPWSLRARQLGGWLVVGVAGAGAEFALLRLLTNGLDLPLWLSSAAAAEVLILGRFFVMDHWVFRHARPSLERLLRYQGACLGALLVYWLVINTVSGPLGLPDWIGFLVGTGASLGWSLLTNFLWVWRRRSAFASEVVRS